MFGIRKSNFNAVHTYYKLMYDLQQELVSETLLACLFLQFLTKILKLLRSIEHFIQLYYLPTQRLIGLTILVQSAYSIYTSIQYTSNKMATIPKTKLLADLFLPVF